MNQPEDTAGRREAQRVLRESRITNWRRSQTVMDAATDLISTIGEMERRNHFTEGIKRMLRGGTA